MTAVETILVDDNPGDVAMTQEILAETGCELQLTIAEDGEKAMEVINETMRKASTRPVLVLLDLKLPKHDGLEVPSFIRSSFPVGALKVVVLTGSQHPQDRLRALELAADHILSKPIDMNDYSGLVSTLKEIITSLEESAPTLVMEKNRG
jgi:two-component system response regulator